MDDYNIVSEWYSEDKNLAEMKEDLKIKLKHWEKGVTSNYFPQNASVLDVGCGMGREAFALYDMGFTITGVDISEKAIKEAKQFASASNRRIKFLHTNGKDLPFEDNTFDVVIIWAQTFGIMYGSKQQLSFLYECRRVLKENGIISFSGHDREYLEKNYSHIIDEKKFFPFANSEIYWEMFTIEELSDLAQKAGFKVLECEKGEIYRPEDGLVLHCECRK